MALCCSIPKLDGTGIRGDSPESAKHPATGHSLGSEENEGPQVARRLVGSELVLSSATTGFGDSRRSAFTRILSALFRSRGSLASRHQIYSALRLSSAEGIVLLGTVRGLRRRLTRASSGRMSLPRRIERLSPRRSCSGR